MRSKKITFKLHEHPWLALAAVLLVGFIVMILIILGANQLGVPGNAPWRALITPGLAHVLTLFVIVPFALKLPNGKRSFNQYLADIRFSNTQPLFKLLILGFSCSLLALLALAAQSVGFRILQDLPISGSFLREMIPVIDDLPPSPGYISALPSIFEEISWRGVIFVLFTRKYSDQKAILITGLGFSLLHFQNLVFGVDPAFVVRQVIFSAGMGIFYGVLVLRSNSLLPAMLTHYLVNIFIGSFTHYIQHTATDRTLILSLIINIPFTTFLLISWVRFYSRKWLPSLPPKKRDVQGWIQGVQP